MRIAPDIFVGRMDDGAMAGELLADFPIDTAFIRAEVRIGRECFRPEGSWVLRGDLREPRRAPGSSFSLQSTTEDALMPTLTTREHGEIHVHYHQVTRMAADR